MAEGKTQALFLYWHMQQVVEVSDMEKSFSFFIVNFDSFSYECHDENILLTLGKTLA